MTRTRLSPEERRTQLLDLGDRLFASLPYEDVHIERVAEQAGVSRGLLYHYFPTKRAFFAELVRRGTERMARDTEPRPGQDPLEQLTTGVQRYLEHVRAHRHAVRAFHRGAASADAEVQAVIDASTKLFEDRIVDVLEPAGRGSGTQGSALLRIAVRSWVLMMRQAGQELIDHPEVEIAHVRELCVSAFVGLMTALPDGSRPSEVDRVLGTGPGSGSGPPPGSASG